MADGVPLGGANEATARRLWWGALEILQEKILTKSPIDRGLWIASPLPALYEQKLLDQMKGWVWAPEDLDLVNLPKASLLPPSRAYSANSAAFSEIGGYTRMPLRKDDGFDPLLLIITPHIQVALSLYGPDGKRQLIMRSDQETLGDLLKLLDFRINDENSNQASKLRDSIADLGDLIWNPSIEHIFWPQLSERLASMGSTLTIQAHSATRAQALKLEEKSEEITLLEAITHEVRTPLATIRTLIRSLLKRDDLSVIAINRLKQIDEECTEQIDRFGLIFNAAELQRQDLDSACLAITDLGNMLEILEPVWRKQLTRRGLHLNLEVTPDLPSVLSDPEKLELMMGGLIDRHTRGLQPGGTVYLKLTPAGQRLKLRLFFKYHISQANKKIPVKNNSDLGTVLSWNPTTGSLQLSSSATQKLFESLGGRLKHSADSDLTIFFPLADEKT
tara:strand:- start:368 stop:1708 length:1341 start_codon:yes stop_codon:yes gene_type:complete